MTVRRLGGRAVRQPAQAEAQAEQQATGRGENAEVGTGEGQTALARRLHRGAGVATATLLEASHDVGAAVSFLARLCVNRRRGEREQCGCPHHRKKLLESRHWTSQLLVSIPSHCLDTGSVRIRAPATSMRPNRLLFFGNTGFNLGSNKLTVVTRTCAEPVLR